MPAAWASPEPAATGVVDPLLIGLCKSGTSEGDSEIRVTRWSLVLPGVWDASLVCCGFSWLEVSLDSELLLGRSDPILSFKRG